MSEVISFRLNPDNPQESQTLVILRTKQEEGFTSRLILTDALIDIITDKDQINIDEFNTALEHVQGLLERLISSNHDRSQSTLPQPLAPTLNDNFLSNMKIAAKPGLNFDSNNISNA